MSTNYDVFDILYGEGEKVVNIGELVDGITNIDRGIGSEWINYLSEDSSRYGSNWMYGRLGTKPITVDFVIYGDQRRMAKARMEIARALDSFKGPQRLVFNDEPNRYYNAITDGKITFKEDISRTEGKGTITFLVPDGLSHSTFSKYISNSRSANQNGSIVNDTKTGKMNVTLINNGSVDCYPIITLKSNADNGYYGVVTDQGVTGVGSFTATMNGATVDNGGVKSEMLVDIKKGDNSITTGWGQFKNASSTFITSPASSNVYLNSGGTIGPKANTVGYNSEGLQYNNDAKSNQAYRWVGGVSELVLPADSSGKTGAQNFKSEFNIKWWANQMGQTGFLTIAYMTKDNELLCSFDVSKEDVNGNTASIRFWMSKDDSLNNTPSEVQFQSNNAEPTQTYKNEAFNEQTGSCFITKEGSVFTIGYANKTVTIREPKYEFKECTKIVIAMGAWSRPNSITGQIGKMVIESLNFSKANVKRIDMIPNRYVKDSALIINNQNGTLEFIPTISIPKAKRLVAEDLIHGTTYFSLPPGKNEFYIVQSDFCKVFPDVTIEWNEHYL